MNRSHLSITLTCDCGAAITSRSLRDAEQVQVAFGSLSRPRIQGGQHAENCDYTEKGSFGDRFSDELMAVFNTPRHRRLKAS
jgi:hypothetical protein